jgi:hypothetical protein
MGPRTLLCCLALLGLAGCGAEEEGSASGGPVTELTVRVDPDGKGPEPARQARVRCGEPPEGRACAAAADLRPRDLAPVAGDVACAELYGGPQTATVSGTLNRRAVDARFSRTNACEIARWEKVAPLLEAAG